MQYLGQVWQLSLTSNLQGRRFHFHKEEIPNGNEEESKETSQEKEVVMGSGEAKASLVFCEATLASAIAVRGGPFSFRAIARQHSRRSCSALGFVLQECGGEMLHQAYGNARPGDRSSAWSQTPEARSRLQVCDFSERR